MDDMNMISYNNEDEAIKSVDIDCDYLTGIRNAANGGVKERKKYLKNKNLLNEFKIYWESEDYRRDANGEIEFDDKIKKPIKKIRDEFYILIKLLVDKIGKSRNFHGYSYLDDMKNEAIIHIIRRGIPGFSKGKDNPFSYLTSVVTNKFLEIIKREKKHAEKKDLKDEVLNSIKCDTTKRL